MGDDLAAKDTPLDERFSFGRNWQSYLRVLSPARISAAAASLEDMLGPGAVGGASFLDVGSGSGLSSLAAARLGASRVHSFDFDPDSVACTQAVQQSHTPPGLRWTVERASALDSAYLESLGEWDIVYSWGVLHHTGQMWTAIDLVSRRVRPDGRLFIAIYNDQGPVSRFWTAVKRTYNSGTIGAAAVLSLFVPYFVVRGVVADLVRFRDPLRRYREYQRTRGMSIVHDWKDWLGGFPFEVATPDAVFDYCSARGFRLEKMRTCGGKLGCNEFVFRRPVP